MSNGDLKNNNPITERTMTVPANEFLGRPARLARPAVPADPIFGPYYVPDELRPFGFRRYHEQDIDRYDRTKQEILSRLTSLDFKSGRSFIVSSGTDINISLDSTITIIQSMEEPEKLEVMENEFPEGIYIARFTPNFAEIHRIPRITLENGKYCIRANVVYRPTMEPEIGR